MILSSLFKYWRAQRRVLSLKSWLAVILRSSRVLLIPKQTQELFQLDSYRNYALRSIKPEPFHHLCRRDYLIAGQSMRQRSQCVLAHYQFEDAYFNPEYKRSVYLDPVGLILWSKTVGDTSFAVRLALEVNAPSEGDLRLTFLVNDQNLHRISFSWVDGSIVGLPPVPTIFIGRNQGRARDGSNLHELFEAAFPQNSASFFCVYALQGVAQALDLKNVLGVKATSHIVYDEAAAIHFSNAYDAFWTGLGGVELERGAYQLPLPFYSKPLSEVSPKHRKRSASRRENWQEISNATERALRDYRLTASTERDSLLEV
ncbi:DUF535 family protein [Duganella fentianensis]|uniref:DUF535 family protein n=1 Tax=Duganella fentianensis TaxID=2692177 RepID=UPI0032B1AC51